MAEGQEAHRPNDPAPAPRLPQITALSIAFPLSFEHTGNDTPSGRQPPAKAAAPRPPHRHDAGE